MQTAFLCITAALKNGTGSQTLLLITAIVLKEHKLSTDLNSF